MKGSVLYVDCFAGIAGDMFLAAMLDLGVPEAYVREILGRLPLGGYELRRTRVMRGALEGERVEVLVEGEGEGEGEGHHHHHDHEHHHHHDHDHHHDHHHHHDGRAHAHRHYREIRAMLEGALPADVLGRALGIFDRIAEVEARLHGVPVEEVAFHEVGAVDSIVDIVGAAAALAWLAPVRVVSRPVPLGGGMVRTAHGLLPVPAPATLALLQGAPVEAGGSYERTTPTGAAILAASVSAWGDLPAGVVRGTGWGAGTRNPPDRPNLLRLVALAPEAVAADEVLVLEANVDDMNPEWCEPLLEALFAAGALDAWLTPIVMKKGRPALTVAAMCPVAAGEAVTAALFRESTTLGVRRRLVPRAVRARRMVEVATEFGPLPVKVAGEGPDEHAAPEYAACRAAAAAHGVPVRRVYLAALAAYARR